MDQYRKTLKYDTRFLARNERLHQVEPEVKQYMEDLPDVTNNARWLDQDGVECAQERTGELNGVHEQGLESFLQETLKNPVGLEEGGRASKRIRESGEDA